MVFLPIKEIQVDRSSPTPLTHQLFESIRHAIITGHLDAGCRLPSTRELANFLKISRTTITETYRNLSDEGYLVARKGSGHYVTKHLAEINLENKSIFQLDKPARSLDLRTSSRGKSLLKAIEKSPLSSDVKNLHPFMIGIPSLDDFPYHLWAKSMRRQLISLPSEKFSYNDPAGYFPLRKSIAAHLKTTKAIRVEPDQIIIVNGSQESYQLIGYCLADAGQCVWIENPTGVGPALAYRAQGLNIVPIPVDGEGMNFEKKTNEYPVPTLIHISHPHQYPTGSKLSPSRRSALIEYASAQKCWVIEDNYDGEFVFSESPASLLNEVDSVEHVIYVGSFSNVLHPALRMGFIIVPKNLLELFKRAKQSLNRETSILLQAALDDFMCEGYFNRHLRRMRVLYHSRHNALIQALHEHLSHYIDVKEKESGLHVVGWLKNGLKEKQITNIASNLGISVSPINSFCIRHKIPQGIMFGYAPFAEDEIVESIKLLAANLTQS